MSLPTSTLFKTKLNHEIKLVMPNSISRLKGIEEDASIWYEFTASKDAETRWEGGRTGGLLMKKAHDFNPFLLFLPEVYDRVEFEIDER